jgi:hypothetical protein
MGLRDWWQDDPETLERDAKMAAAADAAFDREFAAAAEAGQLPPGWSTADLYELRRERQAAELATARALAQEPRPVDMERDLGPRAEGAMQIANPQAFAPPRALQIGIREWMEPGDFELQAVDPETGEAVDDTGGKPMGLGNLVQRMREDWADRHTPFPTRNQLSEWQSAGEYRAEVEPELRQRQAEWRAQMAQERADREAAAAAQEREDLTALAAAYSHEMGPEELAAFSAAYGLDPQRVTAAAEVRNLSREELEARANTLDESITEMEAAAGTDLDQFGGMDTVRRSQVELRAVYDRIRDIEIEQAGGWANYLEREDRLEAAAEERWREKEAAAGRWPDREGGAQPADTESGRPDMASQDFVDGLEAAIERGDYPPPQPAGKSEPELDLTDQQAVNDHVRTWAADRGLDVMDLTPEQWQEAETDAWERSRETQPEMAPASEKDISAMGRGDLEWRRDEIEEAMAEVAAAADAGDLARFSEDYVAGLHAADDQVSERLSELRAPRWPEPSAEELEARAASLAVSDAYQERLAQEEARFHSHEQELIERVRAQAAREAEQGVTETELLPEDGSPSRHVEAENGGENATDWKAVEEAHRETEAFVRDLEAEHAGERGVEPEAEPREVIAEMEATAETQSTEQHEDREEREHWGVRDSGREFDDPQVDHEELINPHGVIEGAEAERATEARAAADLVDREDSLRSHPTVDWTIFDGETAAPQHQHEAERGLEMEM